MAPNVSPDGPEVSDSVPNTTADVDPEELAVIDTESPKEEAPPFNIDDGKIDDPEAQDADKDVEDTRTNRFVIIVAVAAALGGLIFGYDIGGAGMLMLIGKRRWPPSNEAADPYSPHTLSSKRYFFVMKSGGTFLMQGFKLQFGWECASDDPTCVPVSESEINTDKGLINGLFGTGAAM